MSARLDQVLIGGRERGRVAIADYDPSWPQRFEAERRKIASALGDLAFRIEHIGSTAVPGLAAKPIVDVLVSVQDADAEEAYRPSLQEAGYALRVREPGHRMFRTRDRDVHVHVWPAGSQSEREHLLFREWLRLDDADRTLYASTKRALAECEWPDMESYAAAKSDVIRTIMQRAERSLGKGFASPRAGTLRR